MTDDEILEAARTSGMFLPHRTKLVDCGDVLRFKPDTTRTHFETSLIKFVREAQMAERERCAKLCEERAKTWGGDPPQGIELEWGFRAEEAENCAAAIRKGAP